MLVDHQKRQIISFWIFDLYIIVLSLAVLKLERTESEVVGLDGDLKHMHPHAVGHGVSVVCERDVQKDSGIEQVTTALVGQVESEVEGVLGKGIDTYGQ